MQSPRSSRKQVANEAGRGFESRSEQKYEVFYEIGGMDSGMNFWG